MVYVEMVVKMDTLSRSGIRYAVPFPKGKLKDEVLSWCEKSFGPPGFAHKYLVLDYTIQFVERKDRDWFLLRWS